MKSVQSRKCQHAGTGHDNCIHHYETVTSDAVLDELGKGDYPNKDGTGSVEWDTAYAAKGTMKISFQESPLPRIPKTTAGTCLVV